MSHTIGIKHLDWTVVWNPGRSRHEYLRNADVVIEGDTIVSVGVGAGGQCDEEVDGRHLMAMPGLVNLHCHPAGELVYRGIREEHGVPAQYMTGLYERMQGYKLDAAGNRACAAAAYAELLQSGVTTLVDISGDYEGWIDQFAASGLRGYVAPYIASAEHVMRVPHLVDYDWDEAAGEQTLKLACRLMDEAEAHPCGRLQGMVSPSTIDSITEDLLRESVALSESTGRPLTIHISESVLEFKNMVRRVGVTPVQWADQMGVLGERSILGHALFIDEHSAVGWFSCRDLDLISESGTTVAHCPTPFSRYGQVMQHFGRYVEAGVNMGIGTDTLPKNMLEEMRTASILSRVAAANVKATSLADVFHAATAGGADALGRDDLGRLMPGAKADVVLVDLEHPHMRPIRDPLRSLVFSAAERAVKDVYVDGAKVVDNGRAINIDVGDALDRLQAAQERMIDCVPENDFLGRSAEEITPLCLPGAG